MNRNLRRIVPATIAVAAAASLTTLTASSANAVTVFFGSSLTGVSCLSATDCMAVGWSEASGQSSVNYTLGEIWNGTSWTIVPTPSPTEPGGGGLLEAISCASKTDCVAVGQNQIFQSGHIVPHPLAEVWNGTKWTLVPTAKLSRAAGILSGVSCTSTTTCMAVGSQGSSTTPGQFTLAESWNGTAWKVVPTPKPSKSGGATLRGVSCIGPADCMAAGFDGSSGGFGTPFTLAEKWNGSSWTQLATPTPGGSGSFGGVTCLSASNCFAVGGHATKQALSVTFIAAWNGTKWTAQPSPSPAGQGGAGLGSISCTSTTACMAAGSSVDQIGETTATLAEQWNGQVWTELRSPSPRYNNELNGVACPGVSNCQAVGDSEGQVGNLVTLGEAWNGTKWTLVKTPNR